MDPDHSPESLQNKVQWDLRFYFARRANENIDKFQKSTFQLKTHADTGLKYIVKAYDEQTKNHWIQHEDISTVCMPEIPGNRLCPVKNFMAYLTHLNPLMEDLWQYPKSKKDTVDADVWYKNKKLEKIHYLHSCQECPMTVICQKSTLITAHVLQALHYWEETNFQQSR